MAGFIASQYSVDVLNTMYQFAVDKKFTDFKIRAGDSTRYCHQAVICSKSVYFESICSSGMTEAVLDARVAADVDGQILDAVVKFMYLGKTEITERTVVPLLKASEFIKHTDLKAACVRFMISTVTVRNISTYFTWAQKLGLQEVYKQCMQFGRRSFSEAARSDWLKSLSVTEACSYFQDDELQVSSEEEVISAIEIWLGGAEDNATRKQHLDKLFPCVRLNYCDRRKLEELSVNERMWVHLRHKILEYLQHGKHASTSGPRKSYTQLNAGQRPLKLESIGPRPIKYQEKMVIVGGLSKGGINHEKLLCPGSTTAKAPICANSKWYSVCAVDDSLIISGGVNTDTEKTLAEVQMFSLTEQAWKGLPNMPNARYGHGSAVMERKLYLMTGRFKEPSAADDKSYGCYDVKILDLRTRSWSEGPDMPVSVFRPGVVVVSGNIMVIGGHTGKAWSTQTCKLSRSTNQWVICARMLESARNFVYSTVGVDNQVFVLAHDVFLLYDVSSDQWSRLRAPVKPSFGCALILRSGRLVALGGYDKDFKEPHDHLQVYDLFSKSWSLDESTMPYELCGHAAVMLKMPQGTNG